MSGYGGARMEIAQAPSLNYSGRGRPYRTTSGKRSFIEQRLIHLSAAAALKRRMETQPVMEARDTPAPCPGLEQEQNKET